MLLSSLAQRLGFYLAGDGDFDVRRLRYAEEAEENDLAIARNIREGRETRARAVLIPTGLIPRKTLLYPARSDANGLAAAIALVARAFVESGEAPDYDASPAYRAWPEYPGAMIGANVEIHEGVAIEPFAAIGDNVRIGRGSHISSGATIGSGVSIDENAVIACGARIGAPSFFHYRAEGMLRVFCGIGGARIGAEVHIGANAIIQRGTVSDTVIGDGSAVGSGAVIGHDAKIGRNCLIVSMAGISGQVVMEDGAAVFGQAGICERVRLGAGSIIMAQSRVSKNAKRCEIISGAYNRAHKDELRFRARLERLADGSNGKSAQDVK